MGGGGGSSGGGGRVVREQRAYTAVAICRLAFTLARLAFCGTEGAGLPLCTTELQLCEADGQSGCCRAVCQDAEQPPMCCEHRA